MKNEWLIIFDCDGVVVDSEIITNRVFCEMLNELGMKVNPEEMFHRFAGHSKDQCLLEIRHMLGRPVPDDFVEEYKRRGTATLAGEVRSVYGIEAVLQNLTMPYCIASSGEHEKMKITLGKTGLLHYFDGRIFSAEDVPRAKPAPDVYLHAAKSMGYAPENCIAVEDTPTGVSAAVAAGMQVFGFCARMPAGMLKEQGAEVIFNQMADLPALIETAVTET